MFSMENEAQRTMNIIIVGGSLSALMHGIMLHRLGHKVRIMEQSPTASPVSHMAGVCLGVHALEFLRYFDHASDHPLGIPAMQLQSLGQENETRPFLSISRVMSWDALYFRLRANFDMLASEYVPCSSAPVRMTDERAGSAIARARYDIGKKVLGVEQLESGQLLVRYKDLMDEGRDAETTADMVIGADGSNSIVRRIFLKPCPVDRRYAGYVAWRGVVPEEQVSEETRAIFGANITYSILPGQGGHVIIYNIPGKDGSVEPGGRALNFCWYTNASGSFLENIMTDASGKRHQTMVAPGQMQPEVWEKQKIYARSVFAPAYLEVLENIAEPFLHLITDYCSPRSCFANGKVLLVGDATALLRPHIAFSTNQAAFHALITEKLMTGRLTTEEWEYQVTKTAYLHWRRSVWFGEYFQRPLYVSIISVVVFYISLALTKMRILTGRLSKEALVR